VAERFESGGVGDDTTNGSVAFGEGACYAQQPEEEVLTPIHELVVV
jgi:hypothetical protein